MTNSSKSGKIFGAFLIGAAIGGALKILFAPDKKDENKADDLTNVVKEKVNALLDEAKKELETAKVKLNDFSSNCLGK